MDRYIQLKDRLPLFVMAEWVGGINTGQATSLEDAGPDPIFHPRGLVCTYIHMTEWTKHGCHTGGLCNLMGADPSWYSYTRCQTEQSIARLRLLIPASWPGIHLLWIYDTHLINVSLITGTQHDPPPPCFPSPRSSTSDNKDISIWLRREEEKKSKQTHSKM